MNESEFTQRAKELFEKFQNLSDEQKQKFVAVFGKLKLNPDFEPFAEVLNELEMIFDERAS